MTLYQIQTKYRDEARPRAGILRGREFIMKDSYSFDLDDDGLKRSYERHRETYIKTFDRLGIAYKICFATSGAMGGSASEEFLAPAATGEDTFVACHDCGYAANAEAVVTTAPAAITGERPAMRVLDTPDTPTIESLVNHVNEHHGLGVTAAQTLKNIVVKVTVPGSGKTETLIVGVPGDREVDFKRLEASLAPASPRSSRPRTSPGTPAWSAATSAPRSSRTSASATSSTPGGRRLRLGDRRQRARQARRGRRRRP